MVSRIRNPRSSPTATTSCAITPCRPRGRSQKLRGNRAMKNSWHLTIPALALCSALATDALAAQRVFVRSNGADTGTCTLAAPCRGFAYALTQVDAGGEIVALDGAGYGTVTIDKSVTITANPGFHAGISAASGGAVMIGTDGLAVVLRGLAINGVGGFVGIQTSGSGKLTIENCVVSGFSTHGIVINS